MSTPLLTEQFLDFKIFSIPEGNTKNSPISSYTIIVLVKEEEYGKEEATLLSKIMAAIGLDMDEHVLLVKSAFGSLTELKKQFGSTAVVSFNIPMNSMGIHFEMKPYTIIEQLGTKYLLVEPLFTIAKDKNRKALLWNALQVMFPKKEGD